MYLFKIQPPIMSDDLTEAEFDICIEKYYMTHYKKSALGDIEELKDLLYDNKSLHQDIIFYVRTFLPLRQYLQIKAKIDNFEYEYQDDYYMSDLFNSNYTSISSVLKITSDYFTINLSANIPTYCY